MINEHDIEDMCVPLYTLHKGNKFKLSDEEEVRVPVESNEFNLEDLFTFYHIDGMYSYCKDSKGTVHHFAAWTKVFKL
jgi:hypothetical protein